MQQIMAPVNCHACPVHSTPHHDLTPGPHTCRPFELLEKLTTPGHPLAEHEGRCVEGGWGGDQESVWKLEGRG